MTKHKVALQAGILSILAGVGIIASGVLLALIAAFPLVVICLTIAYCLRGC